jgi:starvation-inducible DNA-binding protein
MAKVEKSSPDKSSQDKSAPARGRNDRLATPTDLDPADTRKIAKALNGCLADAYVLYLKTKNFHWHLSGPHFRDYHLMFDEQAEAIFATTDELAERVRKIGERTITSLADCIALSQLKEQSSADLTPGDMLRELIEDNKTVAAGMRKAHGVCDDADDIASASLLEEYVDQTERRTWFLFESARALEGGH